MTTPDHILSAAVTSTCGPGMYTSICYALLAMTLSCLLGVGIGLLLCWILDYMEDRRDEDAKRHNG
jgi:hypothetical protein